MKTICASIVALLRALLQWNDILFLIELAGIVEPGRTIIGVIRDGESGCHYSSFPRYPRPAQQVTILITNGTGEGTIHSSLAQMAKQVLIKNHSFVSTRMLTLFRM